MHRRGADHLLAENFFLGPPMRRPRRRLGVLVGGLLLGFCLPPTGSSAAPSTLACRLPLTDPAVPVDHAWERHDFTGRSRFRNVVLDGIPAIEATPSGASGLYANVNADVRDFPLARWRWRVDQLQPSADLRREEREDFSAVVFFVFGEPSFLHPQVPTLAYAWTATPGAIGSFIRSPRHPETRVDVKLQGEAAVGSWREESRDLVADYRAAFGREPRDRLRYVALFSDDDQTGEPARAYYGAIALSACAEDR